MKKAEFEGVAMADRLITPNLDNSIFLLSTWFEILKSLPSGINEIYCHPGYPDDELRKYAKYVDERLFEMTVLASPELLQQIKKEGIQLISFNQI